MVNINTALPTAIATPFHPPTEALLHDNLIKPVIPKTEVILSYTKLREEKDRSHFSDQARTLIQNENEQKNNDTEQQQQAAKRRRSNFFSKRSEISDSDNEGKALAVLNDFKLVISAIQKKYQNAVNPLPEPIIDYAI